MESMEATESMLEVLEHKANPSLGELRKYSGSEDVTSKVIGDFGRYQLRISVLMSLLKLCHAWYQLNIIFMAPPQEFWCAKPPGFDMFDHYSDDEWRTMCKPQMEEFPCLIFDPELLRWPDIDKSKIPLVTCPKFVYDTSVFTRTMTSDWDLVCGKHWLILLTQCVLMCGVLLGGVIFGMLADKYGRKNPLIAAIVIQAMCSYLVCVINNYWCFLTIWFILALASGGITIISFVICMEGVGGKWRTIIPVLHQIPFGLGNAVMALLAYWLRDWRKLEWALATLSSLYILYWFWVHESPRWLLANGRTDEAVEVLQKIAATNGREWTAAKIKRLIPNKTTEEPPGFVAFLKSKNMRLRTVLLSIDWFCTGLAFYTFSQFLSGLGGNIFLTVALTGIISCPGPMVCVFVITRVGRRKTIWVFQSLTTICFVALLLIPRDSFPNDWPRLLFAGIGFGGMAASVPTMYLYSGELFPTLGRNVGVGGVTTFARVGSMIAPIIVSLDAYIYDLPIILLALMSLGQMALLIPLPETMGRPLPDTLEEAEAITD